MLHPLVDATTEVRVSGWVWEVHPITKIEVLENGQWSDLDAGP